MDNEREWAIRGWLMAAEILASEFGTEGPRELAERLWGEDEFSATPVNPPAWLRSAVRKELPRIVKESS